MIHVRQKHGVFFAHRRPVDPVHVRCVEKVPHLAPRLVEDLLPLGAVIEAHIQSLELQLVLELDLRLRQFDQCVLLLRLHQHLLAVRRDFIGIEATKFRLLALLEIIEGQHLAWTCIRSRRIIGTIVSNRIAEVKNLFADRLDRIVVRRCDRQRDKPVLQPVFVDLHDHRLLRLGVLLVILLVVFSIRGSLVLRFGFCVRRLVVLRNFNLVTFWLERRIGVAPQRDRIHAFHVAIDVVEFREAVDRPEITARGEEQILPVLAECRRRGFIPAVGDLDLLFSFQ